MMTLYWLTGWTNSRLGLSVLIVHHSFIHPRWNNNADCCASQVISVLSSQSQFCYPLIHCYIQLRLWIYVRRYLCVWARQLLCFVHWQTPGWQTSINAQSLVERHLVSSSPGVLPTHVMLFIRLRTAAQSLSRPNSCFISLRTRTSKVEPSLVLSFQHEKESAKGRWSTSTTWVSVPRRAKRPIVLQQTLWSFPALKTWIKRPV